MYLKVDVVQVIFYPTIQSQYTTGHSFFTRDQYLLTQIEKKKQNRSPLEPHLI